MKRPVVRDVCLFAGIALLTFGFLSLLSRPAKPVAVAAMAIPSIPSKPMKPADAGDGDDEIATLQAKVKELRVRNREHPGDPKIEQELKELVARVTKLYATMFDEAKRK